MAKKEKSATVCGVQAFGESVTEAKRKATEAITDYMAQGREPKLFRLGHYVGLIWIELNEGHGFSEWHYRLVNTQGEYPTGRIRLPYSSGYPSMYQAERAMRRHVAQCLFETGLSDDPNGIIENEEDKHSHANWCRWQRRYAEIKQGHPQLGDDGIRRMMQSEGL